MVNYNLPWGWESERKRRREEAGKGREIGMKIIYFFFND